MAQAKRSPLELAELVEVSASPSKGAPRHDIPNAALETEEEAAAQERDAKIDAYVRIYQVPTAVAMIMVDTGYSKGTAFRIFNDDFKKKTREREAAHVAQQAKLAKQSKAATAEATA